MSFYRWCMRYGAAILFIIAALQLVLALIVVVQAYSSMGGSTGFEANPVSERPAQLLLLIQGLVGALATPALTFFGALVINRLDRRADPREAEPFE